MKLTVKPTGFGTYDVVGENEYETKKEARIVVDQHERLVKAAEAVNTEWNAGGGTSLFNALTEMAAALADLRKTEGKSDG